MGEDHRPTHGDLRQSEADWWRQSDASAANYQRVAVPSISQPWAERLLHRLAPTPGARVFDLACGTGIVAHMTAARLGAGDRVIALDISRAMLAVARSQPATSVDAAIYWQLGTATNLPFRTATFDSVTCAFGLMFFSDQARALTETRRVLMAGGRLAVSVWGGADENPIDAGLGAVLVRHVGETAAVRQAVLHALADPNDLRLLLLASGFGSVAVDSVTFEHRVPLEAMLNRVGGSMMNDATRAAARRDWLAVLTPYIDGDHVRYPATARLATAVA